ncbi:MAG: hypothetical protein JW725_03690 [Candidatus Babeliaceae bacterium]|nr:hypothetical protein [Candidatus Babeliaceae bacterium]
MVGKRIIILSICIFFPLFLSGESFLAPALTSTPNTTVELQIEEIATKLEETLTECSNLIEKGAKLQKKLVRNARVLLNSSTPSATRLEKIKAECSKLCAALKECSRKITIKN